MASALQSFITVWSIIFPVFFGILLGYVWGKLSSRFDRQTITNIILYIAAPCLVFSVISQKEIIWQEYMTIMLAALTVMLGVGAMAFIFLKLAGRSGQRGFYLPTMMMNTANMGLPIAFFAFGEAGLTRAFFFDFTYVFIMFSIGLAILGGRDHMFAGLKLPVLYVAVLSLVIATFKIPVPGTVIRATSLIGQLSIPLMLVLLGHHLSSVKISSWQMPLMGAMLRTLGGLLVAYLFVTIFPVSELNRKIILLYGALPSALMSAVLTEKYQQDADLVASTVVISTLSALIFIPLILAII